MSKNALGAIDDDVDDTADDTATTDADTTDDTVTTDADTVDDDVDEDDAEAEFLAGLTPAQVTYFQGERAKRTKANANARTHRLARRALEKAATVTPKPTPPPAKTTGTPPVVDAAALLAQVRAEFAAENKVTTIKASAERELLAAGLVLPTDTAKHGAAVSRAVKLLGNLADLEPDDVAEEVAELRREMPTLFTAKRRRPAGAAGGPARTDSGAGKTDKIAGLFDG